MNSPGGYFLGRNDAIANIVRTIIIQKTTNRIAENIFRINSSLTRPADAPRLKLRNSEKVISDFTKQEFRVHACKCVELYRVCMEYFFSQSPVKGMQG